MSTNRDGLPTDAPRWLDEVEQRAWRGYRRMRQVLELELERDLKRDTGLSEADYDVLSNLSERDHKGMRLTALADWMLWSPSRLSHHVDRMERRGLVRRTVSPEDGRAAVIVLTQSGRRTIESAAPHHVRSVRKRVIDVLTVEDLEALAEITEKVLRGLGARSLPPDCD